MYKKSDYNIEIETLDNGDILIYNSITGAFGKMNRSTKQLYDKIEDIDVENLENEEDKENTKTLLKNGYIILNTVNELDKLRVQSQIKRYSSDTLVLTIAPTLDCNMACPYCFETKQKIHMNEDVQEALFEFVKESYKKSVYKKLIITWYGGEPTLEVNTIYKLSKKFIDFCNERNIKYGACIVTNGVLLERDVAKKLKEECNVTSAQVTIDGLPDYHNNRRILIDGRESFDIIVNNIDNCKDIMEILVRINTDKSNIGNIKQLVDFFISEKGWTSNPRFYIAPVINYDNSCGSQIKCISGEEYGELNLEILQSLYSIDSSHIRKRNSGLSPIPKSISCQALCLNAYVVGPDGDLYKCWNVIGDKKMRVGNIMQRQELNAEYLKWMLYEPTGDCLTCKLLPVCSGGCANEFFNNGRPTCPTMIYDFKEKLKMEYRRYIENKEMNNAI